MAQGESERKRGTIARTIPGKDFVFIYCPEDGKDYFLHATELDEIPLSQLSRGDDVTFIATHGKKGPRAEQCRRVRP